jgi:hypothetical protein
MKRYLGSDVLDNGNVETLLKRALDRLLAEDERGQASVLKQYMLEMSNGAFEKSPLAEGGFRKFLMSFPQVVAVEQEETTIYVRRPGLVSLPPSDRDKGQRAQRATPAEGDSDDRPLYLRYRTGLKKQNLRVVMPKPRFTILFDMIHKLREEHQYRWRELVEALYDKYSQQPERDIDISKNMINATMLLARRAEVIHTLKGNSLATAPVVLKINTAQLFKDAVLYCDAIYLREILALKEPFDIEQASLAIYDSLTYVKYLQKNVMKRVDEIS